MSLWHVVDEADESSDGTVVEAETDQPSSILDAGVCPQCVASADRTDG